MSKILAPVFCLCLFAPWAGAFAQPAAGVSDEDAKTAKQFYEQGRLLVFRGEFKAAVATLELAVKTDGGRASYQLLLAKAHRYAGQDKQAVAVLEKILADQADHVQAALELADLLSPRKQPDRVIAVLQPLLKFQRDYPLYHLLAEANYQKGRLDAARKYYQQAVKLNPHSVSDHYQLGNIYLAQNRFAQAAASLESAGELGYSSGLYHFKLASVYFNLRNYLGKLETVTAADGKAGSIHHGRFLIEAAPGKSGVFLAASQRSAIHQAAQARQLGVKGFPLDFLMANVYLHSGRFSQADAIYRGLEKSVAKTDAGLFWFHWAQAALGLEDYENYLARLDKAIQAGPKVYQAALTGALVKVANRYHQRGEIGQYAHYLGKAVKESPLSSRLHLALGDAHWLLDQKPSAIRHYKMVLELEPEFPSRVLLLNRIRGSDDGGTPVADALRNKSPLPPMAVAARLESPHVKCPVTGSAVRGDVSTEHQGAKVYFASAEAQRQFRREPARFASQANLQLYLTRSAKVIQCPLTGRRLNPTIKVQVAGAEVPLCCKGCQGRVQRAKPADRVKLLFNADAFRQHFRVSRQ